MSRSEHRSPRRGRAPSSRGRLTWTAYRIACAAGLSIAVGSSRHVHAQRPLAQSGTGTSAQSDTLDPSYVPAGFGSLRQEDIALRVLPGGGLQVRAVPLDERFIRLLSPDSYRALRETMLGRAREIDAIKGRLRLPSYSLWYVSFFALEQGETRFSPMEFIINNVGRDFRPLDIVPLTGGFGEFRLKQRETQTAILIFDGQVDLNQPLTASMESAQSGTVWSQILERVERERTLVRSRAANAAKKDTLR